MDVSHHIHQTVDILKAMEASKSTLWAEQRMSLGLLKDDELIELRTLDKSAREAVEEFSNWKLQDKALGKSMERLSTASRTYLSTSPECERWFSPVNDTDSGFVVLNGPPLDKFNPILNWV